MNLPVFTFIRDDDVWEYSNGFLSVFELLEKNEIPVVLGVIPAKVDKKTVDFLNAKKEKGSYQFDIVQHGWNHRNHNTAKKNKYEFGSLRNYRQQKTDILKGRNKMNRLFGKNFTPAFIPPYHGYDDNTLRIINELKIPLFSAGKKVHLQKKNFLDLPARISLNNYDKDGNPIQTEAGELIKKFSAAILKGTLSGMVFHHHAIQNKVQLTHFAVFIKFLKKAERKNAVKIISLKRLLSNK